MTYGVPNSKKSDGPSRDVGRAGAASWLIDGLIYWGLQTCNIMRYARGYPYQVGGCQNDKAQKPLVARGVFI